MDEKLHDKYHPDFEGVDEIRITTVPRWKESELSGCEWRVSARVQMFLKGQMVHESDWRNVQTAVTALGGELLCAQDGGIHIEALKGMCMQPGCLRPAVVTLLVRDEFSDRGERLDPSELYGKKQRRFCEAHAARGDCGREDADANYTRIWEATR